MRGVTRLWAYALALPCLLIAPAGCGGDEGTATTGSAGASSGGGGAGGTGGGGVGGAGGAAPSLEERLQATLVATIAEQDVPGITAAIRMPDGTTWLSAAGLSQLDPATPMKPDDVLRTGSITKMFTSSILLQLWTEGAIDLDAPLSTWISIVPNADAITLRQVLNHTSGLADYFANEAFLDAIIAQPQKAWTPAELIGYATAQPPSFEPGTSWEYSNTNFILAGMVIEDVTGQPAVDVLHARILDPHGFSSCFLDGAEPLPGPLAHGYFEGQGVPLLDVTTLYHESQGWMAGSLVSNAADINRFTVTLLDGGGLLAPAALDQMKDTYDLSSSSFYLGYGLGLFERVTPLGPAFGHGGATTGYLSSTYYMASKDVAVTVLLNKTAPGASADEAADALIKVLAEELP